MCVPGMQGLSEVFKKFMKEHSQPRNAGERETTLPVRNPIFLGTDAEHFIMSTVPRHTRDEGCLWPPPGLGTEEYPITVSTVPTKHEEKAIAKRNMMALFGQEVVVVSKKNRVVRSAQNLTEDIELDTNLNKGIHIDKAVQSEGRLPQGSRWLPRQGTKSDPGVEMNIRASTTSIYRVVPLAGVRETKQEGNGGGERLEQ